MAKILIADDHPPLRKILKDVLTLAGYEVIIAEDGIEAVEKAKSEQPDLVITDGLMPKLHGFLVCKEVKKLNPPPKVIVLTAVYTKPTYKLEAKKNYGADELITKPFKTVDLLYAIEQQLASSGAALST
jgi:DNA-binding response OmpR family regulator